MRILLVCTANRCRSPMAEGLLRAACGRQDFAPEIGGSRLRLSSGIDVVVSSAGVMVGGFAAADYAVEAVSALGADLRNHVSRELDIAELGSVDLILGMEREHVREVAVRVPSVLGRAFTLKDFVRRAELMPRREDQQMSTWISDIAQERSNDELLGLAADDGIKDPMGMKRSAFDRTAQELQGYLQRLVKVL